MGSILQAPSIANNESPVVNGLMRGATHIADAFARMKAVDEAKKIRAEEQAYRADEREYRRGQDAKAESARNMEIGYRRGRDFKADTRQMVTDAEGKTSRKEAAEAMRRQQGATLFAKINDEAVRHGKDFGTVRDTDGRPVSYDAKRATQAYAQFWEAQRKQMPAHIRALIDEVGTEQAKAIMGGDGEDPAADIPGAEEQGEPMMEPLQPVPSTRPVPPERAPELKNFGGGDKPDNWQQYRNGRYEPFTVPAPAASPTTAPAPAQPPAPAAPAPAGVPINAPTDVGRRTQLLQATNPTLAALDRGQVPGAAAPAPVPAPASPGGGWRTMQPSATMGNVPSSRTAPTGAAPATIPPPPEWSDPAIRAQAVGTWRDLMARDPTAFKKYMADMLAAGDGRYEIIKNDIRGTP